MIAELMTNMMMSGSFIPHGHCYLWQRELVGLHLVADLTIAIAYFSIPLTLFYFVQKREDLPFNWIFSLFGAFIIFCGTTHLLEVWTLWHPVCWLSGSVKALTAIVSAYTAVVLVRLIPQALALPSPAQLAAANLELQQQIRDREIAEAQLQLVKDELEVRVAQRTAELAAASLQASELAERLSLSIDAARLGTWDWNMLADEIVWNDNHALLMDYQPGAATYTYADWERRIHPDDLARVLQAIELARTTQTDYSAEYRVLTTDGSWRWLSGYGRFYYDDEQRPVRMAGTSGDITERKQTELALITSQERLKLAIAGAELGIYDWDIVTNRIEADDRFKQLFGTAPTAEFTDRDWENSLHPADYDRATTALQQAVNSTAEYYSLEYRVIWSDGDIRWVAAFGKVFYNDRVPVRMAGVVMDITDRRAAELASQESEERMRLALDAAQMGIYDWDLHTDTLVWNDYHARLFGYGDAAGEYTYTDWESRVHPEDLPNVHAAIARAQAERTEFSIEYRIVWADGSVRWLTAVGRFEYDAIDRPLRSLGVVFDITERQTALLESQRYQQALRASERRYRALTDMTANIIWSTAATGAVEEEVLGWEAFTGQSYAEYRGGGWLEAIHPEDRLHTEQKWTQAVANLTLYETEHRLRRYDGEYRYMSVRGVPILRSDGSVQEWVGSHTDITERKQDEIALQRSEEFTRRILEYNNDCIKVLDLDGRLLYLNNGGKKLLEIEDFSTVDRSMWSEFWQGADRTTATAAIATAKSGRVEKFEGYCPTATGKPKWWEVTVSPLLDDRGNVEQLMVISHDLTDRVQAELAIKESEERFRATFEQAAVGIAHVALDGRWLLVNQRLCEILGYTQTELLALTFQQITNPADLGTDLEYVRQLVAGEIPNYVMEKRYIHKSGESVWTNLTVSLRRDAAGNPLHFISALEDIRDRKHSEAELRTQAVKLAKATALAERRNQELERFSYIVSHDLKAPLRGIANLSQWIEDDLTDIDPDTQTNLELLRSRVYRMEAMINGLLDYARVGNQPASMETFAVEELLAEIVDSLNIPDTFKVDLPAHLPMITTNRTLLGRVFANLIGNAYKHHDRADGRIRVTASPQTELWEFTVADDGPGIPPENRERVFDIFQTLSAPDKNNTGIGLSIVKRAVENHGGEIAIVDAPHASAASPARGTTFRFTWSSTASEANRADE